MPLMPVPMLIPIPVPMPPVVAKLPSYREQFTSKVELNATRSGSLPVFYRSEDQREDRVQVLELDATRPLRLQIETIKHSAVVTRSKAMGQPDTQQIAGEAHGGKVEYTWSGGQYVAKVIKEPESKMDRRNFARPRRQMLHLGSLPTRELQAGESETVAHNERTAAVAEDMGIGQPRGPMVIRYLGLQQIDRRTMARYDVKLPTLFQQPMGGETVSIPLLTQYELVFDVDGEFVRSVQGQTRGRQTVGTSTYTFDWEFTARRDAQ